MSAVMDDYVDEQSTEVMVNRGAERALLGSLLLDNRLYDVVGDMLQPKHFASEIDGDIFAVIASQAVACKACDTVTVFEHLQGRIDLVYLGNLSAQGVVSQSLVRRHAEIILARFQSRQLAKVVDEAREVAGNHLLPIADRVEQVSAKLASLVADAPGEDWVDMQDGMVEFLNEVQARHDGDVQDFQPTGLRDLDEKLDGGLRGGELVIIGARPSMGKTALAVTMGMNCAERGETTAMFSLEMQRSHLQNRQVAMTAKIALSKIKRPERLSQFEWSQMTAAVERIRRYPFYVNDHTSLNINKLRMKARALKRRNGLRLLIVDYLGLMEGTDPKANRTTQLGDITRNLKKLSKELDIPVIVLAQLNREVEKRVDQIPILSDLRDCGEVEQDADIVLFVHRPIQSKPELGPEWANYAKCRIAKQRGGATGDIDLRYVGEHVQFLNWDGDKPTSFGKQRSSDL